MKPKTVKSFLKMCVEICETSRDELKGIDELTEHEWYVLGSIRAGIQNDLSENTELMDKFKLKVDTNS